MLPDSMHRLVRALAVAVLLVPASPSLAAAPGPVAARHLKAAKADYGNLAYRKALVGYRRALESRDATPAQTFQALLGEGFCLVILGHRHPAEVALEKALTMNPEWTAPPDLSPKLVGIVSAARARLDLSPVILSLAPVPGGHGGIAITAQDAGHRIATVSLSVRLPKGSWQTPAVTPKGPGRWVAEVTAGAGHAVDVAASALNKSGFAIAESGTRVSPKMLALPAPAKAAVKTHLAAATPPPPKAKATPAPPAVTAPGSPAPAASPGRGMTISGIALGGGGVVVLVVASYFEIEAQQEAALYNGPPSKLGSSSHAQAVGASAVSHANLATGLFVGGGVLAATGAALVLLGHHQSTNSPALGPEMSVLPVPGGAMVVATGRLPF